MIGGEREHHLALSDCIGHAVETGIGDFEEKVNVGKLGHTGLGDLQLFGRVLQIVGRH